MRPGSVWAAVAAGLWVLCTVGAATPPALPALALPLVGAPDAGDGQGAEGPLRDLCAPGTLAPPASLHPQAHGESQRCANLSRLAGKPIQTRVGSSGCPQIQARVCSWEDHGQMQRGAPFFAFSICLVSHLQLELAGPGSSRKVPGAPRRRHKPRRAVSAAGNTGLACREERARLTLRLGAAGLDGSSWEGRARLSPAALPPGL
uniref:Interferon lambda 4 (gene/pseudogene) n=1 Tax=Colobus angolensis palliatus TaxID=336983 RepID=A0A2K5I1A4_COLAP